MKKSLLLTKRWLLLGALLLIAGATITPAQAQNNPWGVADTDTIRFRFPGSQDSLPKSGSIFNAIDPQYIANRNGFTTQRRPDGREEKYFELITYSGVPDSRQANSLSVATVFNFFIDDILLFWESRMLISALMPQAIEKVTFISTPEPTSRNIFAVGVNTPISQQGEVRFYTRTIPSNSLNENTLYLLDGVEITSAIFEAIQPVFIRSLQRITDSDELNYFSQNDLQEAVKIETFDYAEIRQMRFTGNRRGEILLVNDIELPIDMDRKLKRSFFRMHQTFRPGCEGFEELEQRFPEARSVRIITICSELSEL